MKKIEQKFIKYCDENELIVKGDKILVALSGGPDSVFLLSILFKYKNRFDIEIGAFHLNHNIRGRSADLDEEFCKSLCEVKEIKFFKKSRNVKIFAEENHYSLEEAGRKIRYEELNRTAKKNNYNKIATAHNSDDNAETVFLNLIKGAGLQGISGIPPKRENIIRPILSVSNEEIINYLKSNNIQYRIDQSNYSSNYDRNFLRNEILTLVKEKLNPALDETLLKSSEIFRAHLKFAKRNINEYSSEAFEFNNETLVIKIGKILSVEDELLSLLVKENLDRYFQLQSNFDDCKKVLSLLKKQTGRKVNLSDNLTAFKERNEILIFRETDDKFFKPVEFEPGDKIKIDERYLKIEKLEKIPEDFSFNKNYELISAANLDNKFTVRRWKAGDKFIPLGLKGSKKVSDFLNEQKIPAHQKKNQLLLLNNNKIVWIIGLRIDDRVKINSNTKKVFNLCLK